MKLYSKTLIDLSKRTDHVGAIADATHEAQLSNPLCGDRVTLFAIVNNQRVVQVRHQTRGCALCKASAEVLCAKLEGGTVQQVNASIRSALDTLGEMSDGRVVDGSGELEVFADIHSAPVRLPCLTLPWDLARKMLDRGSDELNSPMSDSPQSSQAEQQTHPKNRPDQ